MASINELLERLRSDLDTLATAIRAKTGKTDNLDLAEMAAEQDAVFEAGKKAEYDAFWDAFQNNGTRTKYRTAFFGEGWNAETFKPKYPFEGILDGYQMFKNSNIEHIPYVDMSQCTSLYAAFDTCKKLHTVDKVKFSAQNTFSYTFGSCENLVNVEVEGVIANTGLSFNAAQSLSKASITSVINALSPETSGMSVTINRTAVVSAFGGTDAAEWAALIATKPNWTISLA